MKVQRVLIDFRNAKFFKADLSGANLNEADLSEAYLKDATGIPIGELEEQPKSLEGTALPDWSKHS